MRPSILLLSVTIGSAVVMMCCSSSNDAPSTTPPLDAGPGGDASIGNDAATDAALPATSSGDYKSGTRLRAQLLTADGVSLWTAWKDTKLGIDCMFDLADDKKLRCIPTAETLDGMTFSDIDCKQAVHRGRVGCAGPTFARAYPTACGEGSAVFRLGAVVDTTVVYEKSASGCNQIPVAGFEVYPVASAVAATELVAGTTKQVTIADGVATTVLEAEDGASQITALYDVARKTACVRGGGTKDDRCVPVEIAFEEKIYSDMGCMASAAYRPAYADDCTGTPPAVLKDGLPGMCGVYEAQYAEVGAKVTTLPLFRKSPSSCNDANITPTTFESYWAVGAAIPQTSLPALTNVDEGAGRVKLRADGTSSSKRLHGRTFFDSVRNEACIVLPTSDGVERCAPAPNATTQPYVFSDDKCEKPLAQADAGCSPPTFVQVFGTASTVCAPLTRRFFKVGAKVTPAQVFQINGTCVPGTIPPGDLYDAATELLPSTFTALTRKTD